MGRRNEHTREEQREMALAAAELILVKDGIAGFSMRRVAQAIGYTVGNLYLLFSNQDDLIAGVNERTGDALHAYLLAAIEPARGAAAKVHAMGGAYVDYARRNPNRFLLMFEHQLPEDMRPRPSTDLRHRRLFELVESNLSPLMPGARGPALRSGAVALWSAVHGVAALACSGKLKWSGLDDARRLSDGVMDIFLAGLPRRSRAR